MVNGPLMKLYFRLTERLPAALVARLDQLVPRLHNRWGGPFNGQERRRELVAELLRAIEFRAIVETGTFTGATTSHLRAVSRLPVYSVESESRFHHHARFRLRRDPGVHLTLGDTRQFLRALAADPRFPRRGVLFYLDAHWATDLPLAEELAIIGDTFHDSVIVIDDFRVPDDSGYGYDNYGAGKSLELSYLPATTRTQFSVFWPAARADEETGMRRGAIVLVPPSLSGRVAPLRTLRPLSGSPATP